MAMETLQETQIRAEDEADAEVVFTTSGAELTARLGLQAQAAIPTAADQPAKIVLTSKAGKSLRFDLSAIPFRPEEDLTVGTLEMDLDFEEDELPMMKTMSLPLRAPPGLQVPHTASALPSLGSAGHADRNCQPCAWFWKPGSCQNGQACTRCHMCPEGELKSRRRVKKTMLRLGLIQSTLPQSQVDVQKVDGVIAVPCRRVVQQDATPMTEGGESTSCSGSELESLVTTSSAAGSSETDMGTSSMSPLGAAKRHPSHKWLGAGGAPRNDGGLPNTPLFETSSLPAGALHLPPFGADADEQEEDVELPMAQAVSLQAPPGLTSLAQAGSETASVSLLHEMGACQPCGWFWKPGGCKNGVECLRCHACPVGELKARKKAKRTMMRLGLITPKADVVSAPRLQL